MRQWLRNELARAPAAYGAVLVLAVAFLAYANTLDVGFHYDDEHHVVGNPFVRDLSYVPQYFHRADYFSAVPGHDMYRPVELTSFALDYHWGGYDPLVWRLTAIALHGLCAVGVFLTVLAATARFDPRPVRARTRGALVAALFFAVHPVLTETVDYASARSGLLATAFVVWAFLLHLYAGPRRSPATRSALLCGSLVLFALGLLSKETAIVFPALLLWLAWLERRGYLAAVPAIAVAGVYLFVRREVLGAAVIDFAAHARNVDLAVPGTGGARSVADNLFTQARVVTAYILLFLWPRDLCIDHWVRESHTPFEAGVLLGAALIAALLAVAVRLRRPAPLVSLGIFWFFIALAPESSLIPLNQVMNERRLYLPAAGMALALAPLVRPHLARAPRVAWPAVAGAALVLLALTMRRNEDWRDPLRIWESAVEVSPQSERAWNSLGVELRGRDRFDEAVAAFRRARELDPYSWNAPFNLGTIYLDRGRATGSYDDLQEAERWLLVSLEVRPGAERSRWFLAETHHAMGRVELAESEFRAMAGLSPRLFEMTRHALARIAADRGHWNEAESLLREAVVQGRDPVGAYMALAQLALDQGHRAEALAYAKAAMEARPHAYEPHLFLARLNRGTALAVHHLFEAERRGYRPTPAEREELVGRP